MITLHIVLGFAAFQVASANVDRGDAGIDQRKDAAVTIPSAAASLEEELAAETFGACEGDFTADGSGLNLIQMKAHKVVSAAPKPVDTGQPPPQESTASHPLWETVSTVQSSGSASVVAVQIPPRAEQPVSTAVQVPAVGENHTIAGLEVAGVLEDPQSRLLALLAVVLSAIGIVAMLTVTIQHLKRQQEELPLKVPLPSAKAEMAAEVCKSATERPGNGNGDAAKVACDCELFEDKLKEVPAPWACQQDPKTPRQQQTAEELLQYVRDAATKLQVPECQADGSKR